MTEQTTYQLDRKTRAIHSTPRWAVQRLQPNGNYDMVATLTGGPRALLNWCRANDVHPTRAAEEALSFVPESNGFKDR